MNPATLNLIRTRRRVLAAHWARAIARIPAGGQMWKDHVRVDRQVQAGMDALVEAANTGNVAPFVEFAGRFGGEAFALAVPLEEVVRALMEVKSIVLASLSSDQPSVNQDTETNQFLNRLVSAGVIEVIQRHERQRARREQAEQSRLEELRERARQQIVFDQQTGLFNATFFPTMVSSELARSQRFGRTFALALVTLDQEEEVIGTLGPEAGAAMQVHLASILTQETRTVDLRASLGSGRFGLVLPETLLEGAFALAERIRRSVESNVFVPPGHPFPLTMTVSIGLACYPQDAETAKRLLERAEEALARARAGGNTTVAAASARDL